MRHIVKPLLRQYLMPLLVILQVALACAIACNAFFLLQQRLVPLLTPDGVGEPDKLIVASDIASRGQPWPPSRLREVELALRALPGVQTVSVAGSIPMETNAQMNGNVLADGTRVHGDSAVYIGDNLVDTLALKLVAGRDFSVSEKATHYKDIGINANGPTIITQALARHLFPDGNALGKVIRIGDDADAGRRTVVGVVEHLMRNKLGQDNRDNIDYSMLFPGMPGMWPMPVFGVRTHTPDVDSVRKAIKATIEHQLGNELVQGFEPQYEMYASLRDRMLARSKAAVWLLAGVSVVVLIVTLAGIMGLTSYWVQQRSQQIGVRRALGARRSHILRAVQIENLLVVGMGVLLGLFSAYAINLWLMRHYELSRLPWIYLPIGVVVMLLLGQLAVLAPALRAAAVPPAVATRSV